MDSKDTHFTNEEIAKQLSKKLNIISVGSGMGVLESYLCDNGFNVICIDPTLNKRDPYTKTKMTKKPNYKNVKEYMENKEVFKGDPCHLLLNYPLPDYILYDICSIYDLQPKFITIIAGYKGHSGSTLLHIWLRQLGVDTMGKVQTEKKWSTDLDIDMKFIVKEEYKQLYYKLKDPFPGVNGEINLRRNFMVTLLRMDKSFNSRPIMSPTYEEVVLQGNENIFNSYHNCYNFLISQTR
jgi:hypothetical protein